MTLAVFGCADRGNAALKRDKIGLNQDENEAGER